MLILEDASGPVGPCPTIVDNLSTAGWATSFVVMPATGRVRWNARRPSDFQVGDQMINRSATAFTLRAGGRRREAGEVSDRRRV